MRKLMVGLAWLIGIGLFASMAFGYTWFARKTANESVGAASVWVYTPHVGPGDDVHLEVKAYEGYRLGIRRVRVDGGAERVQVDGRGRHWGHTIRTKTSSSGSDGVELAVKVPADHPVGAPLQLTIDTRYAVAVPRKKGKEGFRDTWGESTITLEVAIRSAPARWGMRALDLLRALLCFAGLVWLYVRAGSELNRFETEGHPTGAETEGLGYVMLAVGAVLVALGYPIFALPLMAATGLSNQVFAISLMVVWGVAPLILAWQIRRRRGTPSIATLTAVDPDSAAPLAAVLPKLQQIEGVRVGVRGRWVHLRRGRKDWVRVHFFHGTSGLIHAESVGPSTLLMQVACAVADAAGPLKLASKLTSVDVPRRADRAAVQAEWDENTIAALQAMMERLSTLLDRVDPAKG